MQYFYIKVAPTEQSTKKQSFAEMRHFKRKSNQKIYLKTTLFRTVIQGCRNKSGINKITVMEEQSETDGEKKNHLSNYIQAPFHR